MKWIAVPTKQDGAGYLQLITQRNGPALFGAWIALVQVAGKCFPRGVLIRQNGRPHDPLSLSLQSRVPSVLFEKALPFFLDEVCWLESITTQQVADLAELSRARVYSRAQARDQFHQDNTQQDKTQPKPSAQRKSAAAPRRAANPVDDDYIAELQKGELYRELNVRQIYLQMIEWCKVRNKVPSRRRLINFLNNRLEDTLTGRTNEANFSSSGNSAGRGSTASERRTTKLRGRNYSDLARGSVQSESDDSEASD